MSAKKLTSDKASASTAAHVCNDVECKTKARIIEVAERMIASNGVQQVSIRDLTREANVNLAAINYHFGSKERLVAEVLARRVTIFNSERMALLDKYEAAAKGELLSVELILDAAIRPLMKTDDNERDQYAHTAKMLSRFFLEPDDTVAAMLRPYFVPFKERFFKLLSRAVPTLSRDEVEWRAMQILGLLHQHMLFADGRCKLAGKKLVVSKELRRLVGFCAAGMRAVPDSASAR